MDNRELAERRRLVAELSVWMNSLSWAEVRADFAREFGSSPTPEEATSFAVAKHGDEKIKAVWKRLHD